LRRRSSNLRSAPLAGGALESAAACESLERFQPRCSRCARFRRAPTPWTRTSSPPPGWTALLEAIVLSDGGPQYQRNYHARSRGQAEIRALLESAGERP
jgi:hypothetical protein